MTAPTRRDDIVSTLDEAASTRPQGSSARVARKAPLGWLPWLVLGLLTLLLALVLLVVNAVDDDGAEGDPRTHEHDRPHVPPDPEGEHQT